MESGPCRRVQVRRASTLKNRRHPTPARPLAAGPLTPGRKLAPTAEVLHFHDSFRGGSPLRLPAELLPVRPGKVLAEAAFGQPQTKLLKERGGARVVADRHLLETQQTVSACQLERGPPCRFQLAVALTKHQRPARRRLSILRLP